MKKKIFIVLVIYSCLMTYMTLDNLKYKNLFKEDINNYVQEIYSSLYNTSAILNNVIEYKNISNNEIQLLEIYYRSSLSTVSISTSEKYYRFNNIGYLGDVFDFDENRESKLNINRIELSDKELDEILDVSIYVEKVLDSFDKYFKYDSSSSQTTSDGVSVKVIKDNFSMNTLYDFLEEIDSITVIGYQ